MTVVKIRPNNDFGPNAWNIVSGCILHHDCVDENCSNPSTTCQDGNKIGENETNPGTIEVFEMDTPPSDVDEITVIAVYIYGLQGLNGGNVGVRHWVSGDGWHPTTKYLTPPGPPSSGGWAGAFWALLTYTKAQGNTLRFELTANTGAKLYSITVDVFYAELTYTPVPPGYGHDFIGIPAANIGSAMGIPTANIDNISGV